MGKTSPTCCITMSKRIAAPVNFLPATICVLVALVGFQTAIPFQLLWVLRFQVAHVIIAFHLKLELFLPVVDDKK